MVGLGLWVYVVGFGVDQLYHGLQVGGWVLGAGDEGVGRVQAPKLICWAAAWCPVCHPADPLYGKVT